MDCIQRQLQPNINTFLIAAVIALTAGCTGFAGWQTVRGSGHIVTEERPVSGFDRVEASGAGELTLLQGNEESLSIETDDNLLPFIRAEVHNGQLFIGTQGVNLSPSRKIAYRLKLKNLTQLQLSGAVDAKADSLKTDRLALGISGAGNARFDHLDTRTLTTAISGAGKISASGKTETQVIRISGAGKHQASDLQSAHTEARVSGAGDVRVWATESLVAEISGSGSVEYRGNARVNSHVSGAGRVRHAGD
jgi:hypothetical protein